MKFWNICIDLWLLFTPISSSFITRNHLHCIPRYLVGQKMANGAFGQVRLARDNVTDEELAVKLENSNAKMPMLFLEYRFYKVTYI